ncbi:MAG TPA: flippase [Candidatus Cloacimonadota bacterium]|nr:flippase [Candidatus Cloacimonadota bacterium]
MSYSRNIGHNLLTQLLKIVFGVLTGVIVARALGPSGQGYIAYIVLIFTLMGNFGHFGITNAVAFFQKKSNFERSAIFSTNLNVLALISLSLGIGVLFLHFTGIFLQAYSIVYVGGGILMLTASLFLGHHQSWMMGDEKIIRSNNLGLLVFFLKSCLILVLWLFGGLSPLLFFLVTILATTLWCVLILWEVREKYLPMISMAVLKEELKYGIVAWSASLFAYLHYRADQIMIKSMLGTSELGVYTVAVTIAELLFLFPVSINSALSGRLYNIQPQDDAKSLLCRTTRVSMIVCLGLFPIGVLGSLLIPLVYGAPYAEGTYLMLILLPGVLFACLPKILSPWFFSSGRPKVHLRITFLCLALNIILNVLFIPLWGSRGAAFASTLSYVLYGVYYLCLMRFSESFSFSSLLKPKKADLQILHRLIKGTNS